MARKVTKPANDRWADIAREGFAGQRVVSLAEWRSADTANVQARQLFARAHDVADGEKNIDAIEALEAAVQLDPEYAEAHHKLGVLLHEAGEHTRARPELERAVALDPSDPRKLVSLALAQEGDETYRTLKQAISLNPELAAAHLWLGIYLEFRRRPVEALAALRAAAAAEPTPPEMRRILSHGADCASAVGEKLERSNEAIDLCFVAERERGQKGDELLRRAIALQPDFLEPRLLLADRCGTIRIDEGIEVLNGIVEHWPENTKARTMRALLLHQRGDWWAALPDFEVAAGVGERDLSRDHLIVSEDYSYYSPTEKIDFLHKFSAVLAFRREFERSIGVMARITQLYSIVDESKSHNNPLTNKGYILEQQRTLVSYNDYVSKRKSISLSGDVPDIARAVAERFSPAARDLFVRRVLEAAAEAGAPSTSPLYDVQPPARPAGAPPIWETRRISGDPRDYLRTWFGLDVYEGRCFYEDIKEQEPKLIRGLYNMARDAKLPFEKVMPPHRPESPEEVLARYRAQGRDSKRKQRAAKAAPVPI